MEIGETLYVTDREKWRKWLANNYDKKKEIWLVFYNKASGKSRIPYNDAVEEALCYGWIDGIVKKMDEDRFAQRFSPRRKTSVLSEMNKQRIRMMIKQKRMTDFGLKAVAHAFDKDKDKKEKFIIPTEILSELKKNKLAWRNFQKFPEHYKRIRIAYIGNQGERGEEEFRKKLDYFIKMTEKNKRFGMMR
ncbi:MAG: YdeI/OmpD-associated family protein [Nanobdellota archaeon]